MVRRPYRHPTPVIHYRRWKLLLEPTDPFVALRNHMSTNLLAGKTIVDIFSDFMRYLFDSTKALFISSDQNGEHRWNGVSHNIELVLTHPIGWGGLQQSQLRTAAVRANIVPSTPEGLARVHFVAEGEAIFNFCVAHTQPGEDLKVLCYRGIISFASRCLICQQRGDKVLIVDAGEETIDISSCTVANDEFPLQVEELFQPKCGDSTKVSCPATETFSQGLLQGGKFVTARAREMISGGSPKLPDRRISH